MDPLVFEPYFRPQIWGSRRLEHRLGKRLPPEGHYGESWELSAHPHHVSRVAEGPLRGQTIADLWAGSRAEFVGENGFAADRFPWLLKFLDCDELLSVQVHPNDDIAREIVPGESGKTEAWVVIDAEPDARIYAGLLPGVDRAVLERHLDAGTVAECLHAFRPEAGDCVFLPAGTVHAVGGGVVLAEIQQSSDATFRLFDWNRLGADGRPRALHRPEALRSIDWSAGPVRPARARPIEGLPPGVRGERLAECRYFALDRLYVSNAAEAPFAGRLALWAVIDGAGELRSASSGYRRVFHKGDTLLAPAAARSLEWAPADGAAGVTLLGIHLPE